MPLYVALTYTPDVDWTAPEFADEMKEWNEFGQGAAAVIRRLPVWIAHVERSGDRRALTPIAMVQRQGNFFRCRPK